MKMKWTIEQSDAINKEGSNIIVSAGAGSGKTAVLSQRVLRKLQDGVDIREILILTFTNEAAGEMAMRIRKKIKGANLPLQLEYIDSAYITTFDAYALSLVKKYHYVLNIGQDITIIDSSVIDIEKQKILDQIFEELYQKKEPNFLKLIKDFTSRDDQSIKDAVLNIAGSLNLKSNEEEYLTHYVNTFYNDKYIDDMFLEYFNYLKNKVDLLESQIYQIESFMEEKNFQKLYDEVSRLFKPNKYDDLYKVNMLKLPAFRGLDEAGIALKEEIKENFATIMEGIKYSREYLIQAYKSTKDYVEIIIEIIKSLEDRLSVYKKNKNAYEFTDIAKMAIKILQGNDNIRNELKYGFKEIMIDEYQDTSDLQEIFISLIENDNVYMVGDIKQSIYRFRNANPNIFKNKYDNYAKHIKGEKIDLLKNFRSREEVLFNINEIFNFIMIGEVGGVDYGVNHAMVYGNKAYIEKGSTTNNNYMDLLIYSDEDKEFSNDEKEAFIIAKDIKEKIKNKYQVYDFDLESCRDITYNDFCIILDRGTAFSLYKKIFEYFHIPMDVYKDSNLMNETDIYIIKNIIGLILAIKNKVYDKNMQYYFTSIARSYVGNLSDQEIFTILENNKVFNTDIYQKCWQISKNIQEKTPLMVMEEIIQEFNIYESLITVGNIDGAKKRLSYLLDMAKNMGSLGFTITDFSAYLGQMIEEQKEIRYKEAKSSGMCVKIMNIHKSKGLEFPICYFAGFKRKFNLGDLQNRFMFDNKYGILTPYYQEGIGTTFVKTLIKNQFYENEIAEKIRLFYVALTRAKEKMIMVMPEFKNPQKVNNKLDYLKEMQYRSFYDFFSSIALNLQKYIKPINLNELNLTKDYEIMTNVKENALISEETIEFRTLDIASNLIQKQKASKTILEVIDKATVKKMQIGTKLHEMLEYTDFKNNGEENSFKKDLEKYFNFTKASVYQEMEFVFEEYHGVIDLMLEYPDEIKIVDYKLKDLSDDKYLEQLQVYKNYVSNISTKKVTMYLYSLLDKTVKKLS